MGTVADGGLRNVCERVSGGCEAFAPRSAVLSRLMPPHTFRRVVRRQGECCAREGGEGGGGDSGGRSAPNSTVVADITPCARCSASSAASAASTAWTAAQTPQTTRAAAAAGAGAAGAAAGSATRERKSIAAVTPAAGGAAIPAVAGDGSVSAGGVGAASGVGPISAGVTVGAGAIRLIGGGPIGPDNRTLSVWDFHISRGVQAMCNAAEKGINTLVSPGEAPSL